MTTVGPEGPDDPDDPDAHDVDDDPTTVVGAPEADERTVIVGAGSPDDADERTVIVGPAAPAEADADLDAGADADERTVIVEPAAGPDADSEGAERTVIVAADQDAEADERTVIVDPEPLAGPEHLVGQGPDPDPDPGADFGPGPDLGPDPDPARVALDEQAIRRVVRARRLEREPLQPMPVPPGRNGPVLPGAGAGAVFVSDVRTVEAPIATAPRPTAPAAPRPPVPSVSAASRRASAIAHVVASASVLVAIIGLVWVIRELLGA